MANKPFETQDGIRIMTGDDIVDDQGNSLLGGGAGSLNKIYSFGGIYTIIAVDIEDNVAYISGDFVNDLEDFEYLGLTIAPPQLQFTVNTISYDAETNRTLVFFDSADITVSQDWVTNSEKILGVNLTSTPTGLFFQSGFGFEDGTFAVGANDRIAALYSPSQLIVNEDGTVTFPDGSIQTTAYTSQPAISKYVAVNTAGTISGSSDGITWTDYQSTLNSIERVAVGPNRNVYIAESSTGGNDSLWYADTYDTEPTEVQEFTPRDFNEVKYFSSISKFVAVGDNGAAPDPADPALYYSDNGINWTMSTIDSAFLSGLSGYTGNCSFVDISENSSGFFIMSDNTLVGGFFVGDITSILDGSNNVSLTDVSGIPNQIVWANSGAFIGWHIFVLGEGTAWYYNSNTSPLAGPFSSFGIVVEDIFLQEIGISSQPAEFIIGTYNGLSTIMISTSDGQIAYWPAIPAGPFVSVPKPYTTTITGWTSSATSAITYNPSFGPKATGEKFTVTGSSVTGYNGTYYIGGDGNIEVFTNIERTIPFDTSALDPFTGTATITWSHGQYIDALHYTNGIFYAGNDDEEIFKSTDGGVTWTLVDQLSGVIGEEDFLNDIDSYVNAGGAVDTGDITFNGVDIRGDGDMNTTGIINLVPNSLLKSAGQYVSIYPTNQFDYPHIHIAAGTDGELYIGNDQQYVKTDIDGDITISSYNTDTTTSHVWNFGIDGSTTFPTLTVPISDNATPSGTGQTLKFSDSTQQAIIYGPSSTVDSTSAERVIIQGAPGFAGTTGEGGDVYLWAGPGGSVGGDGGDIKIRAGQGRLIGSGGYLNFQGGSSDSGNGGWISIESGSSNTYGNGGYITIQARSGGTITLRTYNSEGNTKEIVLDNSGTTTFPGAIVKSTVTKIGIADNVGLAATLSDAGWTDVVDGSYGPFTLGFVTFTVVVSSGVAAYTVTANSGNSTQGEFIGTLNSADLGGTGSHTSNITVATVTQARTAIDLTKSVNKLTNNISDNNYYLADGVEGQVVYLVPTPNTSDPENIKVLVNHARNGETQSLNAYLWPFGGNDGSQYFTGSICTLIYTDDHWQQVGGNWV